MDSRKDARSIFCNISNTTKQFTYRFFPLVVATVAKACNTHDEAYFKGPSNLDYEVIRQCNMGELSGGKYYDKAINNLGSDCSAKFGGLVEASYFDSLASWRDGGVEFFRESINSHDITQQILSFEECVKNLFNNAEREEYQDRRAADEWLGIGIGIFCGIVFLGFLICCIGGLSCEYVEKKNKKAEAKRAAEEEMKDAEEVVIEPLADNPPPELTTSSTSSRPSAETSLSS